MDKKTKVSEARVLLYDIETTPLVSYTWGIWQQDVIRVKESWNILSVAYKWLGESKTNIISLPDYSIYKKDKNNDLMLVKDLWKLFDEADVIIGHNSDDFDNKKSTARFIQHKLPPPSPYKTVDTKRVAKKYFKFDSNKLDNLGQYLGLGKKLDTGGFDLWLDCMKGDMQAWKKMCKYNVQDVVLLEKVYLAMLPYITGHPNIALMNGEKRCCPNCGGSHVRKRGFGYSRTNKFQKFQCFDCFSWHQSALKDDSQIK